MVSNVKVSDIETNGRGSGSTPAVQALGESEESEPRGEFHNFIADIEDLITSMTSLTGEDLARAKAKLSERVAAAKESVDEMSTEVVHRARKTARATNRYVEENPWQAVGIGAALGLLVGVLLGRRN
jgi:ElaB/YqjD/DUF883 family membrane-anchored ribosome-binding protein